MHHVKKAWTSRNVRLLGETSQFIFSGLLWSAPGPVLGCLRRDTKRRHTDHPISAPIHGVMPQTNKRNHYSVVGLSIATPASKLFADLPLHRIQPHLPDLHHAADPQSLTHPPITPTTTINPHLKTEYKFRGLQSGS